MRIGLSGAQSVGKTTLLNALRSEPFFKDFYIGNEVTRRVKSYGLPINELGNDITQRLIMQEHLVHVFMYERMITDRTVLDGVVYSAYLLSLNQISQDTYQYAQNIFDKVLPYYDFIFYLEPEFELEDDGIRSTNLKFRNDIIHIFNKVIEIQSVPVHRIFGTVRERVEQVLDVAKEYHERSTKTQ